MTDFNFDEGKKFTDNCMDFLKSVKDVDPEMAAILEANWEKLLAVVSEGERDKNARAAFNKSIAFALDDFLNKTTEEDGI